MSTLATNPSRRKKVVGEYPPYGSRTLDFNYALLFERHDKPTVNEIFDALKSGYELHDEALIVVDEFRSKLSAEEIPPALLQVPSFNQNLTIAKGLQRCSDLSPNLPRYVYYDPSNNRGQLFYKKYAPHLKRLDTRHTFISDIDVSKARAVEKTIQQRRPLAPALFVPEVVSEEVARERARAAAQKALEAQLAALSARKEPSTERAQPLSILVAEPERESREKTLTPVGSSRRRGNSARRSITQQLMSDIPFSAIIGQGSRSHSLENTPSPSPREQPVKRELDDLYADSPTTSLTVSCSAAIAAPSPRADATIYCPELVRETTAISLLASVACAREQLPHTEQPHFDLAMEASTAGGEEEQELEMDYDSGDYSPAAPSVESTDNVDDLAQFLSRFMRHGDAGTPRRESGMEEGSDLEEEEQREEEEVTLHHSATRPGQREETSGVVEDVQRAEELLVKVKEPTLAAVSMEVAFSRPSECSSVDSTLFAAARDEEQLRVERQKELEEIRKVTTYTPMRRRPVKYESASDSSDDEEMEKEEKEREMEEANEKMEFAVALLSLSRLDQHASATVVIPLETRLVLDPVRLRERSEARVSRTFDYKRVPSGAHCQSTIVFSDRVRVSADLHISETTVCVELVGRTGDLEKVLAILPVKNVEQAEATVPAAAAVTIPEEKTATETTAAAALVTEPSAIVEDLTNMEISAEMETSDDLEEGELPARSPSVDSLGSGKLVIDTGDEDDDEAMPHVDDADVSIDVVNVSGEAEKRKDDEDAWSRRSESLADVSEGGDIEKALAAHLAGSDEEEEGEDITDQLKRVVDREKIGSSPPSVSTRKTLRVDVSAPSTSRVSVSPVMTLRSTTHSAQPSPVSHAPRGPAHSPAMFPVKTMPVHVLHTPKVKLVRNDKGDLVDPSKLHWKTVERLRRMEKKLEQEEKERREKEEREEKRLRMEEEKRREQEERERQLRSPTRLRVDQKMQDSPVGKRTRRTEKLLEAGASREQVEKNRAAPRTPQWKKQLEREVEKEARRESAVLADTAEKLPSQAARLQRFNQFFKERTPSATPPASRQPSVSRAPSVSRPESRVSSRALSIDGASTSTAPEQPGISAEMQKRITEQLKWMQALDQEKRERERIAREKEWKEQDRRKEERRQKKMKEERLAREKLEKEQREKEKQTRREEERMAKEKREQEKAERDRLVREKEQESRREAERLEKEAMEKELQEKRKREEEERMEAARKEQEKFEKEARKSQRFKREERKSVSGRSTEKSDAVHQDSKPDMVASVKKVHEKEKEQMPVRSMVKEEADQPSTSRDTKKRKRVAVETTPTQSPQTPRSPTKSPRRKRTFTEVIMESRSAEDDFLDFGIKHAKPGKSPVKWESSSLVRSSRRIATAPEVEILDISDDDEEPSDDEIEIIAEKTRRGADVELDMERIRFKRERPSNPATIRYRKYETMSTSCKKTLYAPPYVKSGSERVMDDLLEELRCELPTDRFVDMVSFCQLLMLEQPWNAKQALCVPIVEGSVHNGSMDPKLPDIFTRPAAEELRYARQLGMPDDDFLSMTLSQCGMKTQRALLMNGPDGTRKPVTAARIKSFFHELTCVTVGSLHSLVYPMRDKLTPDQLQDELMLHSETVLAVRARFVESVSAVAGLENESNVHITYLNQLFILLLSGWRELLRQGVQYRAYHAMCLRGGGYSGVCRKEAGEAVSDLCFRLRFLRAVQDFNREKLVQYYVGDAKCESEWQVCLARTRSATDAEKLMRECGRCGATCADEEAACAHHKVFHLKMQRCAEGECAHSPCAFYLKESLWEHKRTAHPPISHFYNPFEGEGVL